MGRVIWIEDVIGDYQRGKLKKKIKNNDPVHLKKHFREKKPEEMAEIFGEKAVIASPEGKRFRGKTEIQTFWEGEIGPKKNREVIFEPVCIYVREVKDPTQGPDKTLHVAHEVGVFRLISENVGSRTNCTGSWTRTLRHPQSCEWEP
ncbi:MAG: hypothetical protein KAU46_02730 [Candidatus Aminicenantes bacterium]|nr:hypothetical protein [Candidatus Aminicenantes bacterium]